MFEFIQHNYMAIVAILWSVDQTLKLIGTAFKINMIDNLADGLGNILSSFSKNPNDKSNT